VYRAPSEKSAREGRWTKGTLASRDNRGHRTRTTSHRKEGLQNHARENKQTEAETGHSKHSRQKEAAEYRRGAVGGIRGWEVADSVY